MSEQPPVSAPVDPVLESRVLRKVAVRVLPLLVVGLFISYVDRANMGVLHADISRDLGLSPSQFGLAAGVFFIGYLFFEIPSNLALVKYGARLWLTRIMLTWGALTMLLATAHTPTMLYIFRILLGIAEAGFYPGVILYLTFWFPRRLANRGNYLFQLAIPFSLAVTSLLTSWMLGMDGVGGIAGWRWVFLLQGLPAVLLGLLFLWKLPERPSKAKWLTKEESTYLEAQTAEQLHGVSHEIKHLPAVLRRPAAWMFTLMYTALCLGFWALTYFMPSIIQTRFGVDARTSGYLSAIPWAATLLVFLFIRWNSKRTGDQKWHIVSLMVIGFAGMLIAAYAGSPVLALVGLTLAAVGMQSAVPLFWTMPAAVFAGVASAIAIAMINSVGNLSGLVGPYLTGRIVEATGTPQIALVLMAIPLALMAFTIVFVSNFTDWTVAHRTRAAEPLTDRPEGQRVLPA